MLDYATKMLELGARASSDRLDPSPEMLAAFEARYGLELPRDYRAFVGDFGAMGVDAEIEFQEPTPLGRGTLVAEFFGFYASARAGDLEWAMDIVEGEGICVPIADTGFGDWFVLMCTGPSRGRVFLRDADQRHLWPDREFHERFPELAPSIERYLAMRRANELPPPLSGTAGWYLVGASFEDFLERCLPTPVE